MPPRRSLDDRLARLSELADVPLTDEVTGELRKALAAANNFVVAKAARIAGQRLIAEFAPTLAAAFPRFLKTPTKTDKGCRAKSAIVEALDALEYGGVGIFEQGIRHVQMEPVYGGSVDTAAVLRSKCALALTRVKGSQALLELATLLADTEPEPRAAAMRALGCLGGDAPEALLRFKALTGDPRPDILSECFSGLMQVSAERTKSFVAGFLASNDLEVAEGAAIALAESRAPGTFELLLEHWHNSIQSEVKQMLLLPLALTRNDNAFDFLLEVVANESRRTAAAAVKVLLIYNDQRHTAQIQAAVKARNDPSVTTAYHRATNS